MIELNKNGFTLIELLAVVVIITVVIIIAVPAVTNSNQNARNKITALENKNLTEAGKMLALDLDNKDSSIYNCNGWVSSYCTKTNSKWSKVEITVNKLKEKKYLNDTGNHLGNVSITITKSNNDYSVTIN